MYSKEVPLSPEPITEQSEPASMLTRAAAAAGVALLAGTLVSCTTASERTAPVQAPVTVTHTKTVGTNQSPDLKKPACLAASPTDIRIVTHMFDAPQPKPPNPYPYTTDGQPIPNYSKLYKKFYDDKKQKLGMYTRSFIAPNLNNDGLFTGHKQLPFEAYLRATNRFTRHYGFSVVLATPALLKSAGVSGRTPSADERETDAFKNTLLNIDYAVSAIPVKFIRNDARLKHVIIDVTNGEYAGVAITGGADDTILIDGKAVISQEGVMHEIFHLEDTHLCGGAEQAGNDPAYAALNRGTPYIGTANPDAIQAAHAPVSLETYLSSNQKIHLNTRLFDAFRENNAAAACSALTQSSREKNPIKMLSDYNYTNVVEDKGSEGAKLLDAVFGYSKVLDPEVPAVRAKARELLARIFHQDPNVVRYFSLMAYRPYNYAKQHHLSC